LNIPILRYIGRGFDSKNNPLRQLPSGARIPLNEEQVSRTNLIVHIENHEELVSLFDRLEKIPGVIRIQRVFRRKQFMFYFMALFIATYVIAHPFLLMAIKQMAFDYEALFFVIIYAAIAMVFLLLLLLRSMGNKTFPHFEETRVFWPLSFGVTLLLIITQFVNDRVFDLHLHTPLMIAFSVIGLVFLFLSYRSNERRKAKLLKRMEAK
jgi:hypothetical protein